jgi:hypothetical protein
VDGRLVFDEGVGAAAGRLPPAVRAVIYRALAGLPEVALLGTPDLALLRSGRVVVSLDDVVLAAELDHPLQYRRCERDRLQRAFACLS